MSFSLSISEKELSRFSRIGVAHSGGVDSSCLLKKLTELNIDKNKIYALHFNHGVHEDSDSWEEHCKKTSKLLGVNFESFSLNLSENSSEEEMRDLRYKGLENWFQEGDVILTAHHKDDQIETILFRLFRGTSMKGLAGIPSIKKDNRFTIIRPLLDMDKDKILQFAKKRELNWIEDSSNIDNHFSRNFIRNRILPIILERWPNLPKSFDLVSRESSQAIYLLNERAQEDLEKANSTEGLCTKYLSDLSEPRLRNLIRYWLGSMNISPSNKLVSEILLSFIGAKYDSSPIIELKNRKGKKLLMRRYDERVCILPEEVSEVPLKVNLNWDINKELHLRTGILKAAKNEGKGLSSSSINSSLEVRAREGGEKFCPAGKNRTRSLKKLYQESKIPPWVRDRIPLIYIENKLAAVPGLWISKEFSVPKDEVGVNFIWEDNLGI